MKHSTLFTGLLLLISVVASGQSGNEKKEVLRVVQQLFDAMASQDTLAARQTLMPDGQIYAVQDKGDSVQVGRRANLQFVRNLVNKERVIEERMREKEVKVELHKQLAMVWAPYDLWINKKFSHCGIDIFTLIKTNQGWKIASLVYTVEPQGCQTSGKSK
jgi:hypothetical protein